MAWRLVRGSISSSFFIVGAGGPGGLRVPWPNAEKLPPTYETTASQSKSCLPRRSRAKAGKTEIRRTGSVFMIGVRHLQTDSRYGAAGNRAFPAAWHSRGGLLESSRAEFAGNRLRPGRPFHRHAMERDCCGGEKTSRARKTGRCPRAPLPNL